MIAKANFSMEHIQELRRATKCDPGLLERTLYAFGLLEALSRVGLSFTFKGGTSLMLLLEHPMRLSTDVDIVVKPQEDSDYFIIGQERLQLDEPEAFKYIGWQYVSLLEHPRETARETLVQDLHKR